MSQQSKEVIAFMELKIELVKLMRSFAEKHAAEDKCLVHVLLDALSDCLSEVQYQIEGHPRFTSKQIDHICYQIGDWYLMMKPLLEEQHNLGHMKERLKIMICGDER